jgi:GWxTD domain-containing protein
MRIGLWACLALFSWVTGTLSAESISTTYYDISFLNANHAEGNVKMVLQLKPNVEKALVRLEPGTDALVANLEFNIEARTQATRQTRHSWRFRKQVRQAAGMEEGLVRVFHFNADPGAYNIDIEILDLVTKRRYFETLRFDCRAVQQEIQVSDLELATVTTFGPVSMSQALNGLRIESQPDSLRFIYSIHSNAAATLTARAVLYRQQESLAGHQAASSKWQVQHFRTFLQQSDILRLKAGETTAKGAFPLADALDGTYQLELTLYNDETRVGQCSRSFVLEWPRLREVFANLHKAIEWMKYIADPVTCAHLNNIQDADLQQREFISWWQRRVAPGEGDARTAMKGYFSRVFMANETLGLGEHGWKSDQGKTMILYGPPDMQSSIPVPGLKLYVWLYRSWNLAFLFKEMDGQVRMVNI